MWFFSRYFLRRVPYESIDIGLLYHYGFPTTAYVTVRIVACEQVVGANLEIVLCRSMF
jgi:hypothetical protein